MKKKTMQAKDKYHSVDWIEDMFLLFEYNASQGCVFFGRFH